ncbi:MAG TPA: DEAD/DEAH box helicase, partial [Candidatus Olsenella stercoravium]|nr:DEAD/DEAH box helicase [Candidatus Olsenella stercoravium]
MPTPIDILRQTFGYQEFRPHQAEIVDAALAGRDVLAVMPTSAGKSICYQVPALGLDGLTIVVSPLISLMADQVGALRQMG